MLVFVALNTSWFAIHAAVLGWRGLTSGGPQQFSRVFLEASGYANAGLALHMIAGAVLAVCAPLQALPALRCRWPGLHRVAGRCLAALALVTGCAGLFYIGMKGTIGGWWMSLWFALYGGALIWSAAKAFLCARKKDFGRHSAWAVRFIVLAVGSWIYRMHYVIWYAVTGGAGSTAELTGLFDRIQVFAFFVPYLLAAEIFLRRRQRCVHPS